MNNNVYIIEILCRDTDGVVYNDNYKIGYATYEKAKKNLNRLIQEEYDCLKQTSSDTQHYSIIDYIEDREEKYQREIHIETENYEYLLTRYSIISVEIEDINVRYDEEEDFPINEKLLKDISGMIYKGIYVWYVEDTNTLIFTIYNDEGEYNDKDDIDCMVFRNYTKDEIKKHIEKLLTLDYVQNRLKK